MSVKGRTPAPQRRKKSNIPVITPEPRSNRTTTFWNSYSALTNITESEANVESQDNTEQPTDEDTEWYGGMTTITEDQDDLEYYMALQGAKTMLPVNNPTKMDLVKFKSNLATALTKCSPTSYVGGHVFLILDQEEYRNRVQDQDIDLPEQPTKPKLPPNVTSKYDQQALDIIQRKFPGGLNGLKDDEGNLPIKLFAKEALKPLEGNIITGPGADHLNILQNSLSRKYEPNTNAGSI
eukprot:jgi/Psemu1/11400/gm1.11400_g